MIDPKSVKDLVERDIGRMVIRIDTLLVRVAELEAENEQLRKQLAKETSDGS